MSAPLSINGLASGLDTGQIIDAIMAVERRSVTLLETRQARINSQLEAFRTLNTRLLSLQTSAEALSGSQAFRDRTVSVSDETVLTATAARGAATGTYAVAVQSLARAHQVASQGYADPDATALGTGTVQIQVGDAETTTIDVTDANNTLAGLRDAINGADAGVTAMIVNDGSDAFAYRLLLTSEETGLDNAISTTVDLAGGTAPEFLATSISEVAADSGNAYTGTVTSGGAYTGTSSKSYLIEIVKGGKRKDAEYRISEDGGQTWGSALKFGGGTINVYDDVNGVDLGVDATFADSTFAVGDRFIVDAFVPTVQAAADAEIVFGSGDGQITITSDSNTVTNLLPGVTLNLRTANPAQPIEITIANDTATVVEQVQALVDSYNEVASYIEEQTRYDLETETAGVLLGNNSVARIEQDLREALLGTVPGLESGKDGLYAVGISVSAKGKLSLDTAELEAALADDFDAVARVFKTSGASTHAKIRFVSASAETQPTTDGYAVHVTQAARRGELLGTTIADPANSPLTLDATNNQLVLAVNGTETSTLELTEKTYTSGAELASEIAAKIQGSDVAVGGVDVLWVDEGANGHFEVRTDGYGSTKSVALGTAPANDASAVLGLAGGTSTAGQDVAGTIDGVAAEGSGRLLHATDPDSDASGLWLEVTLGEGEIGAGVDATVTVIKGVGALAGDVLDYLTDPVNGYVKSKEDRFTAEIDRYAAQIERKEEVLAKRRERLVAKFVRLETALSAMQTQSSYLATQLSGLQSFQAGTTGQ